MPYTPGGAFYMELGGSPNYQRTKEACSGSDTWMIPWSAAFGFAAWAIPPVYQIGNFTIKPPAAAFRYDFFCRATSCDLSPWYGDEPGITGKSPASAWCKMKISYKTPDEDDDDEDEDDPETFLTHKLTIGGEMMTVPPRHVKVDEVEGGSTPSSNPDGTPYTEDPKDMHTDEDAPMTILLPTAEHQFTWKSVINPPFSSIYSNIGKVNKGGFLGCDAETLMFLGVDAQREFTTGGIKPWTLDYRFSHRVAQPIGAPNPLTWNHFYVPKKNAWKKLTWNGDFAYQKGNFMGLFG